MEFAKPAVVYFFSLRFRVTQFICVPCLLSMYVDACVTPGIVQSVPRHYSLVFMGPSRGPGLVSVVGWGHTCAVHAQ